MSNVTNVKLDLYYVKANSYIKFKVNISKGNREKSGKLSGRNDRQTDEQSD